MGKGFNKRKSYSNKITKWEELFVPKEKEDQMVFIESTVTIELPNQNTEFLIMLKLTDISEEPLKILFMTQVEVLLWPELISEILINTKKENVILLLLKELILVNSFIAEKKLKLLSEMFYQSIKYQKVPSFPTWKLEKEIVESTEKPVEPTALLLDIQKMELKPELDSHPVPERPFPDNAELPLVLLLVVEELMLQY